MIVGSLVLILAAAGLLIGGLTVGNDWLLGGSIAASLVAAVMLYIGARQSVAVREERRAVEDDWSEETDPGYDAGRDYPDEAGYPAREYPDEAGYPAREPGYDEPGYYDAGAAAVREPAYHDPGYPAPAETGERPRRHLEDGRFDELKRLHDEAISREQGAAHTEQIPVQREFDLGPEPAGVTPEPPTDPRAHLAPEPATDPAAQLPPEADPPPAHFAPEPPLDATAEQPLLAGAEFDRAPGEPAADRAANPPAFDPAPGEAAPGRAAAEAAPFNGAAFDGAAAEAVPGAELGSGAHRQVDPDGHAPVAEPATGGGSHAAPADLEQAEDWVGGGVDEEDPKDEPPIQRRPRQVADAVARMITDVLVIDGRPRYHVAGCVHLLGRESEPLPADEAVDLGFTPCSLCEPDTALTSRHAKPAH